MRQNLKKMIAFVCAVAMMITLVPVNAEAATKKVAFSKSYTALYENDTNKGVYTYTVKNLIKGQKVKWFISGTGKRYAKLSKTTTSVSGTTSSNKLTIRTKKKTAAKNKTVIVTAKIYNKNGKLQNTLVAKTAKIKVFPTKIQIAGDAASQTEFLIGKTYQFQFKITPVNATSTNVWSATDETGATVSQMTRSGAFTPVKEGTYTICVQAKDGSKVVKTAKKTIKVGMTMTDAKQTAVKKIVAEYSSSAKNVVTKDSFQVKNAAGAKNEVKSIEFSADGKEVTLNLYANLKDENEYIVTDGKMSYNFTAHIGQPVSLKILTTQVTAERETPIVYALYDSYGIDVLDAYPGTVEYDCKITNGYLTDQNKIFMKTVGDTGIINLTYTNKEDSKLVLKDTATVVCVVANAAEDTNFTLTTSEKAPDYGVASYKDNHKVASGSNYYAHFRALDEDKNEIKYDTVSFESSDPDTLLINNESNGIAKVTAVKSGSVRIIVTATNGKQEYTYTYEVTVAEPAYLKNVKLDQNTLVLSNRYVTGYKGYINVEATDQYGDDFALNDESVQITGTNAYAVKYDEINDRIIVDPSLMAAGTYSYTVTMTVGTHKATTGFNVVVQTPPENGAVTYKIDMDQPVVDMALKGNEKDIANAKTVNIRLAQYKGGMFYDYVYIQSATIRKGDLYYTTDLTKNGTAAAGSIVSGTTIPVTTVSLNKNIVTKAQTGVYAIELKFYAGSNTTGLSTVNGYLEVTDSQTSPEVAVEHTTASVSCTTALDLAKNCLSVKGVSGDIVECVVTGTNTSGSAYKLATKESVNIKSVTVQTTMTLADGTKVVSNYEISVGKTLKNL